MSRGLTAAEVAQRRERGQVNRVRRSDWAEYLDIAARNTLTLFNALVVPAAAALFVLGDYRAAVAVSGMAVTNLVLGLVQEVRAKWHLDRLTLLAEARARVRRDGQVHEVPAGDVVLDDLLLLGAGEPVVADGPVVEARFLEVDEALLTGESDPVPRAVGDELRSGSFCVAGEGDYRAARVGLDSHAQRTAAEARSYRYSASPLQKSIDQLIRILTATAVALCAGYLALYWLGGGFGKDELVRMVAATITSMVPQGLVLMTTLAFILGAVRLTARGALVQHLNAVEGLASVDTLCLDKTGTLTTNRLHLEQLRVLPGPLSDEAVRDRLRLFASVSLDRASKSLAALRLALGEAQGELLDQLPFKSQNRYSAVRVGTSTGQYLLVLGACEALRRYIPAADTDRWEPAWKELLPSGLRLLLFAEARPTEGSGRDRFAGTLDGFVLQPLALAALKDEVRPEAGTVLEDLARQGVGFKVLSGDNAETVRATVTALAREVSGPALRTLAEGPVVSGAELAESPDPGELIRRHSVFGRVSPHQKVEVVSTLKAQGRQVAMMGDGVNDVLPIKNANVGIAMGEGTQASKTVAGLVLQTNDFGLLPRTIDEGRIILGNLRRAGKLFLTKDAYTPVLIVGALGLLHLPFPYQPQQVTLLNFLTIGVPALLIALGREPPASLRGDFVRDVGLFAVRSGGVIAVSGLALMLVSRWLWQENPQTLRTLLLTALVLLGLVTLWRALADSDRGKGWADRSLRWWAVAAVPVYLAAMYVPQAGYFFELTPLQPGQWVRVLAATLSACVVLWLSDRFPRSPLR